MKRGSRSATEEFFLDFDINKISSLSLYEKGRSIPFSSLRMSYLCSNLRSNIFCISVGVEVFRIPQTSFELKKFKYDKSKDVKKEDSSNIFVQSMDKILGYISFLPTCFDFLRSLF